LRFNFPNKFSVYQHDSNQKYLFSQPMRDSSHGCMRVQDPVKYAEVLLAIARPREGYTENRIRSMFGNSEIEVRLPVFIPVHVTYQTAFVDKGGGLQFRDDIYGRDKGLLAVLKSDERKVADIAIIAKTMPFAARPLLCPTVSQISSPGCSEHSRKLGPARRQRAPGNVTFCRGDRSVSRC
jgi:hypothetical protein